MRSSGGASSGEDSRESANVEQGNERQPGTVHGSQRTGDEDVGWLTVNEAADHLGVTRFVVSRLLRSGDLAFSIDPLDKRRRMINRKQLDALVAWHRSNRQRDQR